jgi:uncharacterized protein with HEPN domain
MKPEDRIRLQHMLDASREALSFISGHQLDELRENRVLLLALVKCVEIIGEAASRVSDELRIAAPHIPWRNIVAMRNRLIHGYSNINPDIVWKTISEEIPLLIEQVGNMLK